MGEGAGRLGLRSGKSLVLRSPEAVGSGRHTAEREESIMLDRTGLQLTDIDRRSVVDPLNG